jgi:hypothetical protein
VRVRRLQDRDGDEHVEQLQLLDDDAIDLDDVDHPANDLDADHDDVDNHRVDRDREHRDVQVPKREHRLHDHRRRRAL